MAENQTHSADENDRRGARRFPVAMRMEIWPEDEPRQADAVFVSTRDVSMRGIYFFSEELRDVGSRLNFVVLFLREPRTQEVDLMKGVARVVRCEPLPYADEVDGFGVALAIEKTTYLLHKDG